jgi:hypothetical protein
MGLSTAILLIAKQTKKWVVESENKTVILLLFFFFMFFCYLGTLPKSGDFWSIISPGNPYSTEISVNYTPLIVILSSVWTKIGSIFLFFNLDTWTTSNISNNWITLSPPNIIQYWFIIPFLLVLLFFVVISYSTLKNKWLAFICFGTFSFISIIIWGQVDIWDAFWIYIALILALKSLGTEDNLKYIFFSMFALGLSMLFKPFGGLLIPIFLIFFWILLQKKTYPPWIKYCLLIDMTIGFFLISFWTRILWPAFITPTSSESLWLINLQLSPVGGGYNQITSIWLLGYVVILYDLYANFQLKNKKQLNKLFIFYIFATIAWFFISVPTYHQWWVLIIPPLLLVLDNFNYKFNYIFYMFISILFLFWTIATDSFVVKILPFYSPIIRLYYPFSIILNTLTSAILLIWIFELRKSFFTDVNEENFPINNNGVLRKFAPIFPAVIIVFLFLIALILNSFFS